MIVKKKARYWLISGFVIFWIEYPVLYMNRRSFVIKTYFDLFNMVLDSFPKFHTACRISIKLVGLNKMHWKRVGSARREEERWGGGWGGTAHFSASVTTENSL